MGDRTWADIIRTAKFWAEDMPELEIVETADA